MGTGPVNLRRRGPLGNLENHLHWRDATGVAEFDERHRGRARAGLRPLTSATVVHGLGPLSDQTWNSEADDQLTCVATFEETHDTKTFVFRAPEGRRFVFEPGQFLTFGFEIAGETVNRCYSLASSPLRPGTASITVKRTPGGIVSKWLHADMQPGVTVRALGPMGAFTSTRHPSPKYLFLSGGSGITPLMSMSRAFADLAAPVDIVFLHAARTPLDLVFRAELDLIARRLDGFRLIYLPERRDGQAEWAGAVGRISVTLLQCLVADAADRTVFCCGPDPFMAAAKEICTALGVPLANYHQESFDFSTLQEEEPAVAMAAVAAEEEIQAAPPAFTVTFARSDRQVQVRADQFVLATARAQGITMPSSCRTGLCGTCKSKLVSGTIDMQHQGGIRQREIAAGFFLPCCSKPLSDLVVDR